MGGPAGVSNAAVGLKGFTEVHLLLHLGNFFNQGLDFAFPLDESQGCVNSIGGWLVAIDSNA